MDDSCTSAPPGRFYFQDGLNVRAYEARAEQEAQAFEDHAPFYRNLAREATGPVLELGCGAGRVVRAMAETGAEVTGLDLSGPMIEEARRRTRAAGLTASFVQADMSDFSLPQTFALICIPFRGFQELLTRRAQMDCLGRAHAHLTPGGRIALDIFDPRLEIVSRPFDPERVDLPPLRLGETTLLASVGERRNDSERQVLTEHWIFQEVSRCGRILTTEQEIHSMRWVWKDDMAQMLEEAGFRVESLAADFSGAPYRPGQEQVWTARRA